MSETLRRKLNRTKKGNRTKAALNKRELQALLAELILDDSIKGLENYAIILTLVTTGLRASELCQLRFDRIYVDDGVYRAQFIGKGAKDAEQEIHLSAMSDFNDEHQESLIFNNI